MLSAGKRDLEEATHQLTKILYQVMGLTKKSLVKIKVELSPLAVVKDNYDLLQNLFYWNIKFFGKMITKIINFIYLF